MTVVYNYYYTKDVTASSGFWSNFTSSYYSGTDDFTSQYEAAKDVSVDAVVTSIVFNSIVFVLTMCTYECLRRLLPSVYSSQVKQQYKMGGKKKVLVPKDSSELGLDGDCPTSTDGGDDSSSGDSRSVGLEDLQNLKSASEGGVSGGQNSLSYLPTYGSLPEVISQNWISNVFNVSWDTVRAYSGLDGYFFLRYIRMNLRVCAVTALWAFVILVPVYATGDSTGEVGWYHLSVANVVSGSWRMWIPAVFSYLFTGFVFFVMKQEYRHFLELRMDFLARGTSYISPQHHYSLMVENIPQELRSERALYDYFDQLFPGKVHSACMVLNLPDLEVVNARCMRVCRRLEKSIAYYYATGTRATHNVGSPRMSVLGIDMAPFDCGCCTATPNVAYVSSGGGAEKPQKGTHVDSISYYTYDLAEMNKELQAMQRRKAELAFSGTNQEEADNWLKKLVLSAYEMADEIMIDSAEDNALRTSYSSLSEKGVSIPQAELMSNRTLYGTLGVGESPRTAQCIPYAGRSGATLRRPGLDDNSELKHNDVGGVSLETRRRQAEEALLVSDVAASWKFDLSSNDYASQIMYSFVPHRKRPDHGAS
jgi:Late exocytosis, associated with Golgi transport/Cytosolic domain of 10TM putative phosphate transporter